jgi:hypothetical protein
VLLRGFRRGEICALADDEVDTALGAVTVNAALVQVGGRLVWGKPKSKAGERVVGLDRGSVAAVYAHRTLRKRERVAAGEAWEDSRRMFTDELGRAVHPDYVSRRFRELAAEAGCRSSSSTRPGTPRRRSRSRQASTSRSCPTNSDTPRPGSLRTCISMSGTKCTSTQPRKSSGCCPDARERRRPDHDRMRPF